MSDLTRDAFLGGRLSVLQPSSGYRAGMDPVLLAAAVPAKRGEAVLELGCGVGVASLCLAQRVPGLSLIAVEVQREYAELARENARANGVSMQVVEADLRHLPADLRARSFDHVFANPPYHRRAHGIPAQDAGREVAFGEGASLAEWLDAATRRLKPKGRLTMIHRTERLPDLLAACSGRLGGVAVRPVAARVGREAHRVLFSAAKGARAPFRLLPPLVVHAEERHRFDGEDYTPEIRAVLRDAAPLGAT